MNNLQITSYHEKIESLVASIAPHDNLESTHQREILHWIRSGAPLCRTAKPATPLKHLVSYMIILDLKAQSMLLVDHKKALLWLPPGGHVEPDEDPIDAAQRELFEELSTELPLLQHAPFFLTMTETVGLTAGHTDISLWYLFQGNSTAHYAYDHSEFNAIRWFPLSDLPFERSDPHLARFCHKLQEVSSHIRTVTHDN